MRICISILFIISISFIEGCQKSNKNNNQLLIFDLSGTNKTNTVKLSELGVNDVQYIPLQTDTNCLINSIYGIKTTNNSVIIRIAGGEIFRFGFDGSFINQVGKLGRGPKEYPVVPFDFGVDSYNKQIFIRCVEPKNKLYVYSFNGKYINTIPCPAYTKKIYHLDGGILCWNDNYSGRLNIDSNLVIIDYKGKIIKGFFKKYKYTAKYPHGFMNEFIMYNFDGNLYTKEIYSDTVFVFENQSFIPSYILDHGGNTLSVAARESIIDAQTFIDVSSRYSNEINLFQFGDYVYSEFMWKQRKIYGFIGSFNGKTRFLFDIDTGIINDIDGGPNISFKTTKDDNTVLSWIDAYKLKLYVASETFKNSNAKYPEKKKALEKLAYSLKENDNPVLMLVKLKE